MKGFMLKIIKNIQKEIISSKEYSEIKSRYMSLIFLALSFFISFAPLVQDNFTFIEISTGNLVPNDITSLFLALFLMFPLISRGIINFSLSTYGLLTLFLSFYILSSLITLVSEYSLNFGIIEFDVTKGLFLVMIMSWIGLPLFAFLAQLLCIIIIILAMMFNNPDFQYEFLLFSYFIFFMLGVALNQKTKFTILMKSFFNEYKDIGSILRNQNKKYVDVVEDQLKQNTIADKNENISKTKNTNITKSDTRSRYSDSDKLKQIMRILNINDPNSTIEKVKELVKKVN